MMLPSIFNDDLFDEVMNMPFGGDFFGDRGSYGKHVKSLMKTDIKETQDGFELDIDLPGYKKDEVNAHLENGYLTVTASKERNEDEQDKDGKYIRRERYTGSCTRSFYVGDAITEEDIRAKYEDGILKLSVPKKEEKKVEARKYIAIEG